MEPPLPDARQPRDKVPVVDEDGLLGSHRAAAVLRRLSRQDSGEVLSNQLEHAEGSAGPPLFVNSHARLLIDGPQTYQAMFETIAAARHHVNLETYILESGELGQRLADLLEFKRAEGVSIKILFDSVGSLGTPPEFFQQLSAAGIAVCEFNPVNPLKAGSGWQINNRDHRKLLVVDGRVAFTGGINISGVYMAGSFGSKRRKPANPDQGWRDTHVEVRGPAVAEFQRLFLANWQRQHCSPRAEGNYFPRLARRGTQAMRVVAADPESGTSETYLALLSALRHAAHRAWLTYGYFVPDQRMLQALKEASRRGVDVRLMLPGFSDFWAPFQAGRSHYTELLEAGVHIFERRDALLHAKTAVIDGVWSSIGSTNLDWRSFVHNYEADVLILDQDFASQMEGLFQLDEKASHEVDLAEWKRRGLADRLKEWFARRWEYLL
ncbi:MAG: cardiolipin synthase B [Zoogloea sp.]|nr:cardiolipin synthase B [Zoogloea sp.]